jgi:hypothetical protein
VRIIGLPSFIAQLSHARLKIERAVLIENRLCGPTRFVAGANNHNSTALSDRVSKLFRFAFRHAHFRQCAEHSAGSCSQAGAG